VAPNGPLGSHYLVSDDGSAPRAATRSVTAGTALLLQRQLEIRCYETAWMILHKLRRAMVNATREPLRGEVELDDTWVGGAQAGLRGSRQLRGRKAALLLVAVERQGHASGRVRMEVVPDFTGATMRDFVTRNITAGATIYTDGLKSFEGLTAAGYKHVPRSQPSPRACDRAPNPSFRWPTG